LFPFSDDIVKQGGFSVSCLDS